MIHREYHGHDKDTRQKRPENIRRDFLDRITEVKTKKYSNYSRCQVQGSRLAALCF